MIKAHIQHDPLAMVAKLRIVRHREDGTGYPLMIVAGPDTSPGMELPVAHTPAETTEFVQAIINAAWDAGMRPHGYADERSSITRIEDHLADMRQLVFETPTE